MNRLSQCKIQEIINTYKNTTTNLKEISEEVGVSRKTVRKYLHNEGVREKQTEVFSSKMNNKQSVEIANLYAGGMDTDELSSKFDISRRCVLDHIHKHNVKIRGRGLDGDAKKEVINLYKNGKTTEDIANLYNINNTTVRDYLIKAGVPRDIHGIPEYNIDHSTFDVLSEESAYWIGFLMADGCVMKHSDDCYSVSVALSSVDIVHLYKLRDFVNSDKPVKQYKNRRDTCSFEIYSKNIAKNLISYGVVPRKTYTAKALKGIDNNRHFWRGVVDGDGSIGCYNNKVKISLTCSNFIIDQFIHFVKSFSYTKANKRKRDGSYGFSVYGNKVATTVIHKLYSDCSISLDRKQESANNILSDYGEKISYV